MRSNQPSRPRRILMLTSASESGGGAETAMASMAMRFDRRRYSAVMAAPSDSALLERWRAAGFEVAGTPIVRRLRNPVDAKRTVDGMSAVMTARAIDLVHTNGVAAQLHGGLAARRVGRPVVSHVRDVFDSSFTRNGLLHRLSAAVPRDVTIAASAAVAESMGRPAPCEIIPDAVETDIVSPVDVPAPFVLWCGRLQRWKGCHVFLEAAAVVRRSHPDVRFVVAGGTVFGLEPEYAVEVRRVADRLQLRDAVTFVGHVPDARPWMRAAAFLVHSSIRPEPFGMVTAEAMIQERPVVAFAHGGVADNVVDNETGRLVPAGDTAALAAGMIDLLENTERRGLMGRAARTRARALYGADVVTQQVERVYDRVLAADPNDPT
jgi:glycosyltransferase involved in cell wall biosynthesis